MYIYIIHTPTKTYIVYVYSIKKAFCKTYIQSYLDWLLSLYLNPFPQ